MSCFDIVPNIFSAIKVTMFVFGLLRLNIFPHMVLGHLFLALITIINVKKLMSDEGKFRL